MAHRSAVAVVSSVQVAAQLAGLVVAVRRRRHFDVPFLTGDPEHVVRDSLWFGTAFSAPSYLLGAQFWATGRLLRGPDDRAREALRWLGTALAVGYLIERLDRLRIRPAGFDRLETPIVAVGWSCAAAMAALARRS